MTNLDWQELGRYFKAAGLHPATLVRRWTSIERFCNERRRAGDTVAQIAERLGLAS